MKDLKPKPIKNKIVENIFKVLLLSFVVPALLTSPFGLYFIVQGGVKYYFRKRDFNREIKRLQKRNYVALTKTGKGIVIKLLEKGRKRAKQIELKNLKLESGKKWDGKWRLFIFDIPEENRSKRDQIRKKLKSLGLYNIQRSVFAFPFDCKEKLELVSDYFKVSKYASYIETSYIDIDKELRNYFKVG